MPKNDNRITSQEFMTQLKNLYFLITHEVSCVSLWFHPLLSTFRVITTLNFEFIIPLFFFIFFNSIKSFFKEKVFIGA